MRDDQAFARFQGIFLPDVDSWIATWYGVDDQIRRIGMLKLKVSLVRSRFMATIPPAVVVLQTDNGDASEIPRSSLSFVYILNDLYSKLLWSQRSKP